MKRQLSPGSSTNEITNHSPRYEENHDPALARIPIWTTEHRKVSVLPRDDMQLALSHTIDVLGHEGLIFLRMPHSSNASAPSL